MKLVKNTLKFAFSIMAVAAIVSCSPKGPLKPSTDPTVDPTVEPTVDPTIDPTVDPTTDPTTEIVYPDGLDDEPMDPRTTRLKIGDQARDFTYTDLDGFEYYLSSSVATAKLVVVNLFASWCGPCKEEFPAFEEIYRQYQGDIEIIALSVEPTDTPSLLKSNFQKKYDITFPIGLDKANLYSCLAVNYESEKSYVPVTVMIDRYGTIVRTDVGSLPSAAGWLRYMEPFLADDYLPYGY